VQRAQHAERVCYEENAVLDAQATRPAVKTFVLCDQVVHGVTQDGGEKKLVHGVVRFRRDRSEHGALIVGYVRRSTEGLEAIEHTEPRRPSPRVGDAIEVKSRSRVRAQVVMVSRRKTQELQGRCGARLKIDAERIAGNRDVAVEEEQHVLRVPGGELFLVDPVPKHRVCVAEA